MSMLDALKDAGFSGEKEKPKRSTRKTTPKKKPPAKIKTTTKKKATAKPKTKIKVTKTGKLKSNNPNDYIKKTAQLNGNEDIDKLRLESNRAKLLEPILKNQAIEYKNEQHRLNLLKESGKVMETTFGEFLYFGYMEKMNIDILMMLKKLKPKIDNLVKEMDTNGVIKEIKKEFCTVMQTIKKSQEKDIKDWKKDH